MKTDGVEMETCPDCHGSGETYCECCGQADDDCESCGGTGEIPRRKPVKAKT